MKTILVLAIAIAVSACGPRQYYQVKAVEPTPLKTAVPEPENYGEPKIGMKFDAFVRLCGSGSGSSDRFSTIETSGGSIDTIERVYGESRSSNMCYGTFTFKDGLLATIYR